MPETAAVWRERIERQQAGGLSITRFCEREGVSTAAFFAWRRRLAEPASPAFLPVRVLESIRREPAVELQRADGTLLRIFDGARRQTLVDVLAALAGDPA